MLLAQSVTVALDRDHLTVMQESVENCSHNHVVAEHATPVGQSLVGGQQDAACLVTRRHKLEEQMSGPRRYGQVAEFVELC